jgi:hypothetical protein
MIDRQQRDHGSFMEPDDPHIQIWRYMDFTKFVAMLEHGGLFFCRADKLGDPFEGSYSLPSSNWRREFLDRSMSELVQLGYTDEQIKAMVQSVLSDESEYYRWIRQWAMISCWHMNQFESAGMWRLYAKSNEAIAVQSRYRNLAECLGDDVHLGVVHYIDYRNDLIPVGRLIEPFLYKRKSFEHEHELRAFFFDPNMRSAEQGEMAQKAQNVGGVWKTTALSRLIEKVYVAPDAAEWFRDLVERLVNRYGLDKPVIQSSLAEDPIF